MFIGCEFFFNKVPIRQTKGDLERGYVSFFLPVLFHGYYFQSVCPTVLFGTSEL